MAITSFLSPRLLAALAQRRALTLLARVPVGIRLPMPETRPDDDAGQRVGEQPPDAISNTLPARDAQEEESLLAPATPVPVSSVAGSPATLPPAAEHEFHSRGGGFFFLLDALNLPFLAAWCAALVERQPRRRELVRRARVRMPPSHLDVHLRRADAHLGIRRTGLDLDPGWLPGLGRIVHFRYD